MSLLQRLTVMHSSELVKDREDGFYVCFDYGDPIDVRVFAQCAFKRHLDAVLAMKALLQPGAIERIIRAQDQDLETRKVMCEALQW